MDHAKPFFLIKWQEWLKQHSTKLSQNISTWNYYILWAIKTLPKLENPTQGHMTSHHKDVIYATKTSIMPQRHRLCHKDIKLCHKDIKLCHEKISLCHEDTSYATKTSSYDTKTSNYATKTSNYHKDGVPRYQCHKDCGIWLR